MHRVAAWGASGCSLGLQRGGGACAAAAACYGSVAWSGGAARLGQLRERVEVVDGAPVGDGVGAKQEHAQRGEAAQRRHNGDGVAVEVERVQRGQRRERRQRVPAVEQVLLHEERVQPRQHVLQRGAPLLRAQDGDGVAVEVQLLQQRRRGGEQQHLLPRQARLAQAQGAQPAQRARQARGQRSPQRVEAQPVEAQPLQTGKLLRNGHDRRPRLQAVALQVELLDGATRRSELALLAHAHHVLVGHEHAREQVQLLLGASVGQDPLVREVGLNIHLLTILTRLLVLVLAPDPLKHRAGRLGGLHCSVSLRVCARLLLHLRLDLVRQQLGWHGRVGLLGPSRARLAVAASPGWKRRVNCAAPH